MGHDISNMHQIMFMQLEMAKEILDSDGVIDKNMEAVITNPLQTLYRSANLIRNVRKLQQVRAKDFNLEPVDMGPVVEDVIKGYSNIPGRDVCINYLPGNGYVVKANSLIKDVINNLVDNAVKHTIDPVIINVSMEHVREDGQAYCQVAIEDNGHGIPDNKKDMVFYRLNRGQTMARGTGLGLYIVKTLVEGFGGTVRIEDRVAGDYMKGARFVVCLPTVETDDAQ